MPNESLFGNSRYAINNIYAILLSGVHLWVRNASITTRDPRNSSLTNVHHWVHTNTRNNGNGGLTERPFIDKLTKLTFQHLLARPATSRVMRFNKTGTWYSEGKTVGPKLRELHGCAPGKRRPRGWAIERQNQISRLVMLNASRYSVWLMAAEISNNSFQNSRKTF